MGRKGIELAAILGVLALASLSQASSPVPEYPADGLACPDCPPEYARLRSFLREFRSEVGAAYVVAVVRFVDPLDRPGRQYADAAMDYVEAIYSAWAAHLDPAVSVVVVYSIENDGIGMHIGSDWIAIGAVLEALGLANEIGLTGLFDVEHPADGVAELIRRFDSYLTFRRTVHEHPVPPLPPPPPLEPPVTTAMELQSTPPGATVAVNGVIAEGETPTVVEVIPGRVNTLAFYLDTYETLTVDIEVPEDNPPPVVVEMVELTPPPDWVHEDGPAVWSPPEGRMEVETDPSGAIILRNGRSQCTSPCEFSVPADQEQHIVARMPGHLDVVTLATAPSWEGAFPLFLRLQLPRDVESRETRYLEVDSYPDGAEIVVDGRPAGVTPFNVLRRGGAALRLDIVKDGFLPWSRTFDLFLQNISLRPVLQRIPTAPSQVSIYLDPPPDGADLGDAAIYLDTEQVGQTRVERYDIDSGTHRLSISERTAEERRLTHLDLEIPAGRHVIEHYTWNGERWVSIRRSEEPAESNWETPARGEAEDGSVAPAQKVRSTSMP